MFVCTLGEKKENCKSSVALLKLETFVFKLIICFAKKDKPNIVLFAVLRFSMKNVFAICSS